MFWEWASECRMAKAWRIADDFRGTLFRCPIGVEWHNRIKRLLRRKARHLTDPGGEPLLAPSRPHALAVGEYSALMGRRNGVTTE